MRYRRDKAPALGSARINAILSDPC